MQKLQQSASNGTHATWEKHTWEAATWNHLQLCYLLLQLQSQINRIDVQPLQAHFALCEINTIVKASMPGIPTFSVQQLSGEQIDKYEHSESADIAARYRSCLFACSILRRGINCHLHCRDIAKALGLDEYLHDAATAVCVDYVSYALK